MPCVTPPALRVWTTVAVVVAFAAGAPPPDRAVAVTFGAPARIADHVYQPSGASVAMTDHGEALVVWTAAGRRSNTRHVALATRPVGARRWRAARTLSPRGDAFSPQLRTNGRGDAVVAWTRRPPRRNIWFTEIAVRSPHGRWTRPHRVPDRNIGDLGVAVTPAGEAVAVWYARGPGGEVVRSAARSRGGRWSAPVTLGAANALGVSLGVATGADGSAAAAWIAEPTAGTRAVDVAVRSPDGAWSKPQQVTATDEEANLADPQVCVLAGGRLVAMWQRLLPIAAEANLPGIEAVTRSADGSWTPPQRLVGAVPGTALGAVLAGAGDHALIAWTDVQLGAEDLGPSFVRSADLSPDGSWSLSKAISAKGDEVSWPGATVTAAGHAYAVWNVYPGRGSYVQVASRRPGAPWSSPQTLSPRRPTAWAEYPLLAAAADGRVVVVWHSRGTMLEAVVGR